jgi:hypothetical protein
MIQALHLRSVVLACAVALGSLTAAHAQKSIHKPATKPTIAAPQGLSLEQITKMYVLEDLPSVDEYLTARNWRFSKSEAGEEYDQVIYIHKSASGVTDSGLNIFLCNSAENTFCAKHSIHEGQTSQHVYVLMYIVKKPVFDYLKRKIREGVAPTGSRTGKNTLTTIFASEEYSFEFITDNSEVIPSYIVKFRDLVKQDGDTEKHEEVEQE